MTDPAVTGPLAPRCAILQGPGARSRNIARDSAEARKSLASIAPEQVYEAVRGLLKAG
jgi:hypothetical protein